MRMRIRIKLCKNQDTDPKTVLRIRIRIRMDPHDFGLLNPHSESALKMRIPDTDADPD